MKSSISCYNTFDKKRFIGCNDDGCPIEEYTMNEKIRCPWAGKLPIYIDYHDHERGRPVHDDNKLFEMLILEGMQAGLSWITVLKKREAYRKAFDGFDPQKVALYGEEKIEELMQNEGIIRNRLKINSAITNAKIFLEVAKKHGSFDAFLWRYMDNTPIIGHWKRIEDVPATTPLSDQISKDLKKMGSSLLAQPFYMCLCRLPAW